MPWSRSRKANAAFRSCVHLPTGRMESSRKTVFSVSKLDSLFAQPLMSPLAEAYIELIREANHTIYIENQ